MGDEKVKDEALQIMNVFEILPRLVVFDLDYTLWPFYCECRSKREMPTLYPQAKGILFALKDKGIDVAIASSLFKVLLGFLIVLKRKCHLQVSKMGVTSILVGNGVNLGAFRQGLTNFAQGSGSSVSSKRK
ncbi:hypothetical protein IFM89_010450 [Coptis chinensis]|uniref:Magnesium-dependent phosphatase n=1 Tax=Coptis chinensis TaxID=261450 RepID=A0A835M2U2_9MAGN|nr:hypothetical protein IFM89_010450 [Coptis chinensis]